MAISPDLRTAWVTLEVNKAIAVVDLWKAKVTDVLGLGLKDHAAPGNGFDASGCRSNFRPRLHGFLQEGQQALGGDVLDAPKADAPDAAPALFSRHRDVIMSQAHLHEG